MTIMTYKLGLAMPLYCAPFPCSVTDISIHLSSACCRVRKSCEHKIKGENRFCMCYVNYVNCKKNNKYFKLRCAEEVVYNNLSTSFYTYSKSISGSNIR